MPAYPTTSLSIFATRYDRFCDSVISATNRFGLQGRGYTCRSIAITPRRWRRRIRVTSSRGASGSLIPSDLRIRLPQVERYHVGRPVRIFPDEPGSREVDERRRRGSGLRRRGDRGADTRLDQLPSIQDGTVPHEQHLVAQRLKLGGEGIRAVDPVVAETHHASGNAPIQGE